MTLPTNFRQSPSGPREGQSQLVQNFDSGAIQPAEVLETPFAWAPASLGSGIGESGANGGDTKTFTSHARISAEGEVSIGLANLDAIATDPGSTNVVFHVFENDLRASPSGGSGTGGVAQTTIPDTSVSGRQSLQINSPAIPSLSTFDDGSLVIASPVNALPAGLAFSECQSDDGNQVRVEYACLNAGAIATGAALWTVCVLIVAEAVAATLALVDGTRTSPSGVARLRRLAVALDHPSCAAALVTEASVAVPGVLPGDVVHVMPSAALPAGLALSHGRCETAGQALIGLANLTAGAIDPVSQNYELLIARLN